MRTCPNTNHPLFKDLVRVQGYNLAYYLFDKYEGNVPDEFFSKVNTEEWEKDHAAQTAVMEKIKAEQSVTLKTYDVEGESTGYTHEGIKVAERVTDEVNRQTGNKEFEQTPKTEFLAEYGSSLHSDIEHLIRAYTDKDGFIKTNSDGTLIDSPNMNPKIHREYHKAIDAWIRDMLNEYLSNPDTKGVRLMSEAVIYRPAIKNKKDMAGTIDFLVVHPNGKVDILDWKSYHHMSQYNDVAWFKSRHVNIQIGEYKKILKDVYGVKEFGRTRGIPIALTLGYDQPSKVWFVRDFNVGSYNSKEEDRDYVLPIPTADERTGIKEIDALIDRLQDLLEHKRNETVLPSERDKRNLELNSLDSAIRKLQVKQQIEPTLFMIDRLVTKAEELIKKYKADIADKNFSELGDKEIADMALDLKTMADTFIPYGGTEDAYRSLGNKDVDLKERTAATLLGMRSAMRDLFSITEEFYNKLGEERYDVFGLLEANLQIDAVRRQKDTLVNARIPASELVFKVYNRDTVGQMNSAIMSEKNKVVHLREELEKEMGRKDSYRLIKHKTEHRLIDEYSKEFYTTLKTRIGKVNDNTLTPIEKTKAFEEFHTWLEENIDVAEFTKTTTEKYNSLVASIKAHEYDADPKKNQERQRSELDKVHLKYGLDTDMSPAWLDYSLLKWFPKRDKWESSEYKELKKHPASFAFYNYLKDRVALAEEVGFYQGWDKRTFIPFTHKMHIYDRFIDVRTGLPQRISEGGVTVSPLTKQRVFTFPSSTTQPIENARDIEQNIAKTLELFNEQLIAFQYKKTVEPIIELVRYMERNKAKGSILTNAIGKPAEKDGKILTGSNEVNASWMDDILALSFYNMRNVNSDIDKVLFTLGDKSDDYAKAINKFFGRQLLSEQQSGKKMTLFGALEVGTNLVRAKALGFNIGSALSNGFGGQFQASINKGLLFSTKDEAKGAAMLKEVASRTKEGKKIEAMMSNMHPFTDNPSYKNQRQASGRKLSGATLTEYSMKPMEWGHHIIEWRINLPMLLNAVVVDGKLLNVRQYVRSLHADRYAPGNVNNLKQSEREMEKEMEELRKTNGFIQLTTMNEDGTLNYPVDAKQISAYTAKMVETIKQATGQMTKDERNLLSGTHLGRSFTMFKGWIPPLFAKRIKALEYNPALETAEWGRFRMFGTAFVDTFKGKCNILKSLLSGGDFVSEDNISYMSELFLEKKARYEKETGKKFKLTEAEFMDMMRQGIAAQWKELLYMGIMIGLTLTLRGMVPPADDPDKEGRGKWAFAAKQVKKMTQELTFFYNPLDIQQMANGNIIPALTLLTDSSILISSLWNEIVGDAEAQEKAHPLKNFLRMLPVFNQLDNYAAVMSEDWAKEMGIRVTSNTSFIH